MSSLKFISIKQFKIHEFNSTLRYLSEDLQTWPKRNEFFGEMQNSAIRQFVANTGQLTTAYLIVTSLRDDWEIALKISDFTAAIPSAYFFFLFSFLYLITATNFNHLSVAMSLKSQLAGQIRLKKFSINAYDTMTGNGDSGLGIPVFLNPFFKEVFPVTSFLGNALLISLMLILVPYAALGYFLWSNQYELVWAENPEIDYPQRLSAIAGLFITVVAGLFVALFHMPIPVRKNKSWIRWGYLFWLSPHPADQEKFERWRQDE